MSGFGLRALKKVKEEEHKKESRLYFDHLVVGDNWEAAVKYFDLLENYPDKSVRLISPSLLTRKLVENDFQSKIKTIRDEASANLLIAKNPRLEILKIDSESLFYKDTKFHKFTGRAKPHEMMEDEEGFKEAAYSFKWQSLFNENTLENFDDLILKFQYNKYIDEIEISEPSDLVEKVNFKVLTAENETFECEHLHWCKDPKSFYKLISNKAKLSDSVHQFCNKLETRTTLSVRLNVDTNFYAGLGTIYLPQSVTHEWGHFICDIEKFDPEFNSQAATAMMFVTEEISTEEELAKKIRLMNRVIERIFPDFAKAKVDEFINYRLESFIKNTDDSLASEMRVAHPELRFYGEGAPLLIDDSENIKYTARAILSL